MGKKKSKTNRSFSNLTVFLWVWSSRVCLRPLFFFQVNLLRLVALIGLTYKTLQHSHPALHPSPVQLLTHTEHLARPLATRPTETSSIGATRHLIPHSCFRSAPFFLLIALQRLESQGSPDRAPLYSDYSEFPSSHTHTRAGETVTSRRSAVSLLCRLAALPSIVLG